jgi:NitT/TauT family transport system substrate-binding protein
VAVAGETIEHSQNPTTAVIVRRDSGITSVKQLAGKRIATPSVGAVIHVSVLHWLKKNGVDPESIKPVEVPFPNMADQLRAGLVDAVEALQPFTGQLLQAGNVSLGYPLLAVGDPVLFPFWIAQGAWAREHRLLIGRWIQALTEAKEWIARNDVEARAIMGKYTGLPPDIAAKIPLPTYQFTIRPEQLKVWIDVLNDLGQLRGDLDATRLVVTAE